METLHIRFPHLSLAIFQLLDDQSISKCREVCLLWKNFIDEEKSLIRVRIIEIIHANEKNLECYNEEILQSAPIESLSKIACSVKQFYQKTPRAYGQTLMHFAAMSGQVTIVKEIIGKSIF